MAGHEEEAAQLLPLEGQEKDRKSEESIFSASTTSLVFERIGERADLGNEHPVNGHSKMVTPKFPPRGDSRAYADDENTHHPYEEEKEEEDLESGPFISKGVDKTVDKRFRRLIWIIGGVFIGAWVLALVVFLGRQAYRHPSESPHDPAATSVRGHGKKVTLDQVQGGQWRATKHDISWIEGANGEDGLLL